MAINKVGSKGIEDGSVASADFAPNTVTSAKLQDGAVTNAKLTNSSVTLTGSSVSLGGSVSFNNKFVDWQSVITADGSTGTTAVSGKGYFIDTTSATHTLTLPSSAAIGDFIAIKDYAGTFGTNNLTIARNGHNIQGVANDSLISTNRASLVLVYVDSTKGWLYWEEHNVADLQQVLFITATGGTVTTSGDYKIHAFTGDGCFAVSSVGNPIGSDTVDYMIVGGGGSGGFYNGLGGGGAGGMRLGSVTPQPSIPTAAPGFSVSATTYPITIGGGGASTSYPVNNPGPIPSGSPSSGLGFTATGGGAGARGNGTPPINAGQTGGSGGGGGGSASSGASGNTPPVSPPQGNNGGAGSPGNDNCSGGGGGGGAATVGSVGSQSGGGAGGAGINVSPIFGTAPQPFYQANGPANGASACGQFAGGAGGSAYWSTAGSGGIGGGGNGVINSDGNGISGTANTGGGGSGTQKLPSASGAGGKGIVLIRYKFQ